MKTMKKTIIAVMLGIALFGCTDKGGGRTFTDVDKVKGWLAKQKRATSPDDPIPFGVKQNLQNMSDPESNWHKLLTAINAAGLYVSLDLSGSTVPTAEFDADGGIKAGKKFIVSLVLPDNAESVAGVLYAHFENLKTAKARNIEYFVGDPGPAGGFVFYDKGNVSDEWRYLEAAPAETEFKDVQWGAYGQDVDGTENGIGTGKRNTELIVAHLNSNSRGETDRAAQVCAALNVNGFSDWFLPSTDELLRMQQNLLRNNTGGPFGSGSYWSSSQRTRDYAWVRRMSNGKSDYFSKRQNLTVRAVRAF